MDGIKEFCKVSTAHAVRYFVDDNTSKLEKIVWAFLLVTAIFQTVNYMQYYWEDNESTPFVTSFSSIPIREVPFPALSVRSTQATAVPPWVTMTSRILDNVEYDCLSESESCMNDTRVVRRHFGELAATVVEKNFDSLQKVYNAELTKKETSQICVLLLKLYGKPAYGIIQALVELVETSTKTINLKYLAAEIFRIPKSMALIKIKQFLQYYGKNITTSSISKARATMIDSSIETQAKLFAFIVSQGNVSPKLSLGSFIHDVSMLKYSKPVKDINDEGALNVKRVLENLLAMKSSNSKVNLIALGGYDTNAQKHLRCGVKIKFNLPQCSMYKNESDLICCTLFNETLSHYETFLGIMKYYMSPMTWDIQGKSYVTDIKEAIEMLPYKKRDQQSYTQGKFPEIFHSGYFSNRHGDYNSPACQFANIYSKVGITNTFNAPYFWSVYKENYFTRAYYNQLYSKSEQCSQNLKKSPLHASSHGQQHAFEAFIPASEIGGEVIELHSPFDVPDLNSRPIHISPGKTYTITVTPSISKVGNKLDNEDMAKLGCQSEQDHNLTLYKGYSQSKCQFECNLRMAIKKCGCIPWNYPHIDGNVPVCLEYYHKSFDEAFLFAQADYEACECPPACNRIHYAYHVDTAQTDFYRVCKHNWKKMGLHKSMWNRNSALRIRDIKSAKGFLEEEFPPDPCQTLMPNMAFVQVYMTPPDVSVALTSLRATLPEHVATFGSKI